jgi:hypothetical protein
VSRLEDRAEDRADVRKIAHETLDEALAMYERGDPLWIIAGCGWTGKDAAVLRIIIREPTP